MTPLSGETIRSFIALDLGSQTLEQILAFQKELVDLAADLKLVEAENIHITLRFLGDISLILAQKIGEEITNLQFESFEASIQGVGVFPDLRHINVVWVGLEKGILGLISVYSQVELILKKLGISPDDRGFNPHITVARLRSSRNKEQLVKIIVRMRDKEFGTFQVMSVKLKKSVLTTTGPIYTTLAETKAVVK